MTKQYRPEVYNGIKTAWKSVVVLLGGVDAVAACTRGVRSMVSEYGSVHSKTFVPVDVLLDAETVAGEPLVTAALARAQGYELVPVVAQQDTELAVDLARLGRDTSDLFARAAQVLAGADLLPSDAQYMLADLDDLMQVARQTAAVIRRMLGDR